MTGSHLSKKYSITILSTLFILSFSLYLETICPTVYWKDSGELTSAVDTLGICHPSGYPVYSILGFTLNRFPIGDIAYRMNLLSALFGALIPVSTFVFLRNMGVTLYLSVIGSMTVVLAHEIWLQAIVTEIYSLSMFLFTLSMALLSKHKTKHFLAAGFVIGLALAHHLTTIILIPSFLILAIKFLKKTTWTILVLFLILLILGASTLIYLPIRSHQNPIADFGNPEHFDCFMDHYLTKHYSSKMWPDTIDPIIKRFEIIVQLIFKQYGFILTPFLLLGLIAVLTLRSWRWFIISFSGAHCIFLFYQIDHSFLIPFIYIIGISYTMTLTFLFSQLNSTLVRLISLVSLTAPIILIFQNYSLVNKNEHFYAFKYGQKILSEITPEGIAVTNGDNGYSLIRYFQVCERLRPDIHHFHRPIITWPSELKKLKNQHPNWFEKSEGLILDHSNSESIHAEAHTDKDFNIYLNVLAQITENASRFRNIFWEGGSDLNHFSNHFNPNFFLYRFNQNPSSLNPNPFAYLSIKEHLDDISFHRSFLTDHNAVSEYAILLYNLGNFYKLKKRPEQALNCFRAARKLWLSQLDPEPHNVLVENMTALITTY